MERSDIFKKVNEIFCDELDNDDIVLTDETTADDVEEWDSLSHVQLIVAIEKAFGIKFTSNEILSWNNVGELIDSIEKRLKE
ncbi:acyl carrier protein [Hallella absiana]|jgi:acyl carrier protein|uniref:acyl carrier protein n=1 Tax=Hallella absiana TaxID=2925336 RepID=UPI0021C5FED5|nr:acyl carrier protein [Hallella absiana]